MFNIIRALLGQPNAREPTISYLTTILQSNRKRKQIQADHSENATDGFMLNLLSIMLEIARPIVTIQSNFDKIKPNYLFHPKYRLGLKDETRLKFNSEQLEEWVKTLGICFFNT